MLNNHRQFVAWRRQVFVRNPHRDLNILCAGLICRSGIYLIGCGDEIVYVGQSWDLTERPIDSLGHVDKRRTQRRMDVTSMNPKKLSAVLS